MTADGNEKYRPEARTGLALIGYRGCGKSSVAGEIAAATGATVVDTDQEITRLANRTIADIFAAEGEAGFRRRESQVIADIMRRVVSAPPVEDAEVARALDRPAFVLSLGGGAVLDPATVAAVQQAAVIIRLTATPETLYRRILGDAGTPKTRPALTAGGDGLAEIREVLAFREPFYAAAAEASVDTERWSVGDVAIEALRHWRRLAASKA